MAEKYYALTRLAECSRAFQSLITEMPLKRQAIEKYLSKGKTDKAKEAYNELIGQHNKLTDAILTAKMFLYEIELLDEAEYAGQLFGAVKGFNLMTKDYTQFMGVIKGFMEKLPSQDEGSTTNATIIGRLMGNVRMGYYPTDLGHISLMQKAVKFPEAKVNLFDPCCGCGLALKHLSLEKNVTTYGIELDRMRAEESQERLDRVGFGSYFHSRISHEAFHLMLLNPPYLSVMNESGSNARHEKRFLVDSICHLMFGGLIMYIVPYYRLTNDICRILCDNFDDLRVFRFSEKEFKKFKQIVVFGVRKKRIDGSDLMDNLLKYSLSPDAIPTLDSIEAELYTLPETEKKVDLFKGAEFNVKELSEQLKRSKSISKLFEKSRLDSMEKRPLLPLNIGQVGLIGGSGLINGIIDCETPHIIKGRIIKETKKKFSEEESTVTETRVNKMIFNILTPEGFRSLA